MHFQLEKLVAKVEKTIEEKFGELITWNVLYGALRGGFLSQVTTNQLVKFMNNFVMEES